MSMHNRGRTVCRGISAVFLILFLMTDCVRGSAQSVSDVAENENFTDIVNITENADSAESVYATENGNLTKLHADFLTEGGYQYAEQFGENLLLIRMYVPETEDTVAYIDGDGELFYEDTYCYQFDLYSPEENAVVASMNTEEQAADFYLIDGARLLLVDYEKKKIFSYDAMLSPLVSYDVSSFLDASDGFVYATADEDSWYFLNYEAHSIQKADYSDGICELSDGELDDYCSVIQMASPDASKLLLSVVDKETYFSGCAVVDADDLSVLRSWTQDGFYWQTISDDAFLAQPDDETEQYYCEWFDGETLCFSMPEEYSVSLLGSYILAVRNDLYAVDEEPVYSASLYNSTGECVSSISFSGDTDGDGEADVYMLSEPVYLKGQDSVFWLMGDPSEEEEGDTYILKWDLQAGSDTAEDVSMEIADAENDSSDNAGADDVSADTDSADTDNTDYDSAAGENEDTEIVIIIGENTDSGAGDGPDEFSDVRSRADALEETYGISIFLEAEVPEQVGNYYTESCLDQDTLAFALDQLETILALYPENFFSQLLYDDLQGIRIYLSGTISGEMEGMLEDPGAYVEEIDHFQTVVLDAYQCRDWDYMLNHEISHMIDRSLAFRSIYQKDALFSEETWSSYNPEGFEYLYTYDGYQENPDSDRYAEYFIDAYGTTFATEDRAELFGTAMSDCLNDGIYTYLFEEGSVLKEKLDYYCACIRDGFNTTGWEETMAWEMYGA